MEVEKETSSSSVGTSKSDQSVAISKQESKVDEQTRLLATVRENPSDFTSWTTLLQHVEQKVFFACTTICLHFCMSHVGQCSMFRWRTFQLCVSTYLFFFGVMCDTCRVKLGPCVRCLAPSLSTTLTATATGRSWLTLRSHTLAMTVRKRSVDTTTCSRISPCNYNV